MSTADNEWNEAVYCLLPQRSEQTRHGKNINPPSKTGTKHNMCTSPTNHSGLRRKGNIKGYLAQPEKPVSRNPNDLADFNNQTEAKAGTVAAHQSSMLVET